MPLSDDKRMQGSHERAWNELLTLGEVLRDIIQGAGFRARVHDDLDGIKLKRFIQSIETDIEVLTQLADAYGAIVESDSETIAVVPRGSGRALEPVTIADQLTLYNAIGSLEVKHEFYSNVRASRFFYCG